MTGPRPTHSPYGFVPLPARGPERSAFPGWRRDVGVTGVLSCELTALGPLFTADHRREEPVAPGDKRLRLGFLRDGAGRPIVQGASLKGMLRAVFEAAFPSCLPLGAGAGAYRLAVPELYRHDRCNDVTHLCPACRLFGIALGDKVHAASRVRFTDAVLAPGSALTADTVRLAELSSPKPQHSAIYSSSGAAGGPIRGRKLYFHHPPLPAPGVAQASWSTRSHAICEYASSGTRFDFQVHLHSLSDEEVCRFLACLVLDERHAHKQGMAKPLGYGSCIVTVRAADSQLATPAHRYGAWGAHAGFDAAAWPQPPGWLQGELEELLRRDRPRESVTGYLGHQGYRGVGLDRHGRYVPAARGALDQTGGTGVNSPGDGTGDPHAAFETLAALVRERPMPAPPQRKKKDKIKVEVLTAEGNVFRLRDTATGQDDIVFAPRVPTPWQAGDRRTVHVETVDQKGRVLRVKV